MARAHGYTFATTHAAQQKQVEVEEEYITNRLMKRLEQLKKEKQILVTEVRVAG
jgi:hypothetical protein